LDLPLRFEVFEVAELPWAILGVARGLAGAAAVPVPSRFRETGCCGTRPVSPARMGMVKLILVSLSCPTGGDAGGGVDFFLDKTTTSRDEVSGFR